MIFYSALLGFVITTTSIHCYRILAIVSTPCYSHQVSFRTLWRELSLRGHQLTVLTTDPMNDPTLTNVKEIDMGISYIKWNQFNANAKATLSIFQEFSKFFTTISAIGEEQLLLPEVQEILSNETQHFDVVLIEPFFLFSAVFAERFKCPLIQMFSLESFTPYYLALGNPSHPSLNPHTALPYSDSLTFSERLLSSINAISMTYLYYYDIVPLQNVLVEKYFRTYDSTSLQEILNKTSMMFVNTETVLHTIRPLVPNIVQFGGANHVVSPTPLPKDLQAKLDNATNGFIYFSLGSTIKSERLPEATRKIFLETFAELSSYTILWKFEKEDLPGKPDNVIISKWLPQQDVLSHPNIKLFIYQGGLQSSEEAIYNNVPMIGIPFIGDQRSNVKRFVDRGIALSLDHTTMNKGILKAAILKILNNALYRNKMKQLVELIKNQPSTGVQSAVWWIEYAVRHNGTNYSRSGAMDLPGYQYFLFDIISFLVVLTGIFIYVTIGIVRLIYVLIEKK